MGNELRYADRRLLRLAAGGVLLQPPDYPHPERLVVISSTAVLLAASVAACLIPARRATKVSPLEALRFE
jgi:hypothetical protein